MAQQVGGLGSEVLQMVFKFHRVAQQEVLSQLLNRIITGCTSPSVDSYFSKWVWLLFAAYSGCGYCLVYIVVCMSNTVAQSMLLMYACCIVGVAPAAHELHYL